ncbi:hypothetical protein KU6B_58450 (plasmid) [Mameliella alba]|uniref:Uncharacterized protein n=1 Tax=Tropicibacter naphthalenivorans TaxID=441103 RepID=A0A0P1GIU2_9RHOB|nr:MULTISPECIES: hypothetical protein [Roseobacteraceae]BBU59580.1 hypothetical protein KU6B_58450 [Mameliella alba]CUH81920.1 hypothetical protein TRN7648_03724 [Tropicibacter naphthalenivorans]SMD02482.1 hypothetical protein SAMN04488093_110142 [Tropicibacter naphthalenivorans]
MSQAPRLTGKAIMRIVSKTSGKLVGHLYEWDNGELQPWWLDGEVQGVLYEPMGGPV